MDPDFRLFSFSRRKSGQDLDQGDPQACVAEPGHPLAFVPGLFGNPPGPAGGNPFFHGIKLVVQHLEAGAHEIIQVIILGQVESFISDFEPLVPIQDEHPQFAENFPFHRKNRPHLSLRNEV